MSISKNVFEINERIKLIKDLQKENDKLYERYLEVIDLDISHEEKTKLVKKLQKEMDELTIRINNL